MTKSVVHDLEFCGQPTSAATQRFGHGCLIGEAVLQNYANARPFVVHEFRKRRVHYAIAEQPKAKADIEIIELERKLLVEATDSVENRFAGGKDGARYQRPVLVDAGPFSVGL